jgi:2-dehydro-3-deoxyphosphogalactonate aldolase
MQRELIGILRGVQPPDVLAIVDTLLEAGITQIEVTLNSPQPLKSIELMVRHVGQAARVGAGTVLSVEQVQAVADVGGQFIVSPNFNASVVAATKSRGLFSVPGVLTPTECFNALQAGGDALKLFPAPQIGPDGLKALRAVLPEHTQILVVGGVSPQTIGTWIRAGANGFGIGSTLYTPDRSLKAIAQAAKDMVTAYDTALQVLPD